MYCILSSCKIYKIAGFFKSKHSSLHRDITTKRKRQGEPLVGNVAYQLGKLQGSNKKTNKKQGKMGGTMPLYGHAFSPSIKHLSRIIPEALSAHTITSWKNETIHRIQQVITKKYDECLSGDLKKSDVSESYWGNLLFDCAMSDQKIDWSD